MGWSVDFSGVNRKVGEVEVCFKPVIGQVGEERSSILVEGYEVPQLLELRGRQQVARALELLEYCRLELSGKKITLIPVGDHVNASTKFSDSNRKLLEQRSEEGRS